MKDDDVDPVRSIAILLLAAACVASAGFVGAKLWAWHVPALFPSAPALTMSTAIGLSAMVYVFFGGFAPSHDQLDQKGRFELIAARFVAIWISLFVGWLAA